MFSEQEKQLFMSLALKQARIAYKKQEVPVGACIVDATTKKVVAASFNKRTKNKDATAHAEVLAIKKACKKIKDFRLENMVMFVTLFPCPMCMGAIVNSRISKVYVGAMSDRVDSSLIEAIFNNNFLNHKVTYECKILENECGEIVREFFKNKRNNKN